MKKSKLIIAACMMAFAVTACSSSTEPTTTKTESSKKESATSDQKTATKDEDASKTESKADKEAVPEDKESDKDLDSKKDDKLKLGDEATLKDWKIKATKMKVVDSIDSSAYTSFSPEEGNKYVQVFVSIENKGKTADTFLPSFDFGDDVSVKLLYGDGYEFSASNLLGYDKELHDTNLNPLASAKKEVAFEVPESVASDKDELLMEFSSDIDTVTYKIR